MTTFVLVHGAFRGGWSWDRVAPLLRAEGHAVHAPTLSAAPAGLDADTSSIGAQWMWLPPLMSMVVPVR